MKKPLLLATLGVIMTMETMGFSLGILRGDSEGKPLNLPGKIVFQTDREQREIDGTLHQMTFLLKDGQMIPLFPGGGARFTHDGQRILYDQEGTLYLSDLVLQGIHALEWTKTYAPYDFDLSPDGQWLAFTSTKVLRSQYANPQYNLMVARSDGTGLSQLTDVGETIVHPRWSPNGEWILFGSPTNPENEKEWGGLFKIRPDGSDLKRIFGPTPDYGLQGTWSLDGKKIALAHRASREESTQIYLLDADGSNVERVTSSADFECYAPVFSPDGTQILFLSNRKGEPGVGTNLFVINADGTHERQVTPSQKIKKYGRWRWATDLNPDWAP